MDKQLDRIIEAVDNLTNAVNNPPTENNPQPPPEPKLEKPVVILMKIIGVVVHVDFLKTLDDYYEKELATFLNDKWEDPDLKERIDDVKNTALQETNNECPKLELDESSSKSQQIESLAAYCKWVSSDPAKEGVRQSVVKLKLLVRSEGWKKGVLKAP